MTMLSPATRPALTVPVELGARRYDILIGDDVLGRAGSLIKALLPQGGARVITVTDETVAGLHLSAYRAALAAAGLESYDIILPPGEQTKSFPFLEQVLERALAQGIERSTVLVALGGGVIGDLAGFAAALALRGIDYVQIPTTLLSQVDSSVGGKTAIDSQYGKNLIGAFHQPRLVLADTATLRTLPRRQILAGYAEVVKYGLIRDPAFYDWCEANAAALVDGDNTAMAEAVRASCAHKAEIVKADEFETTGARALLNLGHTFGHALEAELHFADTLLHGEAVAIGMVMAFDLSVRLGLCPPEHAARMRRHLAVVGLPVDLSGTGRVWNADTLIGHMHKDKKVEAGRIRFVLVRGIGQAFLSREAPLDLVGAVLRAAGAQ
jgi:3-dehydroquinate synthase